MKTTYQTIVLKPTCLPVMTAAEAPSPAVVTVVAEATGYEGFKAFDSSSTSAWNGTAQTDNIAIDLGSGQSLTPTRYRIRSVAAGCPLTFNLVGSNTVGHVVATPGTGWTNLDATHASSAKADPGNGVWSDWIHFTNTTAYRKFCFDSITTTGGGAAKLSGLEISEATVTITQTHLKRYGHVAINTEGHVTAVLPSPSPSYVNSQFMVSAIGAQPALLTCTDGFILDQDALVVAPGRSTILTCAKDVDGEYRWLSDRPSAVTAVLSVTGTATLTEDQCRAYSVVAVTTSGDATITLPTPTARLNGADLLLIPISSAADLIILSCANYMVGGLDTFTGLDYTPVRVKCIFDGTNYRWAPMGGLLTGS